MDKLDLDSLEKEPSGVDGDKKAEKEEKFFNRRDKVRADKFKTNLFNILNWVLYFIAGVAAVVAIIRLLHLVGPQSWHWICDDDLNKIDSLFTSGTLGALFGRFAPVIFQKK